jgi:hypothetical protein
MFTVQNIIPLKNGEKHISTKNDRLGFLDLCFFKIKKEFEVCTFYWGLASGIVYGWEHMGREIESRQG